MFLHLATFCLLAEGVMLVSSEINGFMDMGLHFSTLCLLAELVMLVNGEIYRVLWTLVYDLPHCH